MSIEDRNLKPGTKLVARYKKQDFTCEVVKTKDGIVYRLAGGKEFKSPSSAGSAVMGGSACNGWRFWSVGEAEKPAKAPAKKKSKHKTRAKPTPEQTDAAPAAGDLVQENAAQATED